MLPKGVPDGCRRSSLPLVLLVRPIMYAWLPVLKKLKCRYQEGKEGTNELHGTEFRRASLPLELLIRLTVHAWLPVLKETYNK